ARAHHHPMTALAPKHDLGRAGPDAKHLVRSRVIVMKAVDAVAPLRWPAIARKERLKDRGRIVATGRERSAIEQHRQMRIVRHPAISLKLQQLRFSVAFRRTAARTCAVRLDRS